MTFESERTNTGVLKMCELETSRHLFQRPLYKGPNGQWYEDFSEAVGSCPAPLHLDLAAVASFLSFGMVGLDRTLFREVTRRPWMSRIDEKGHVQLESIPPHGFLTGPDDVIANRLYDLLCDEARVVCSGFREIYILLSGGLDSRIVAGVLADLYNAGEISAKPKAVTWGLADSRDVVYARRMAATLKFEWIHVPFGPETVLENIGKTARLLGLQHSPEFLHHMSWFSCLPKDSLVLAGSFGDSIGRAEFGGIRLLQLSTKTPKNLYNLMKPSVFNAASCELQYDLDAIHSRGGYTVPNHARNEHWMQGFRMRGGLCHALSLINRYATVYQMFTDPAVYGFMWSLHPARRDDSIYAAILTKKLPNLASTPWPRTNRALYGPTKGAKRGLRPHYHEYTKWSSGPLFKELSARIDPEWFGATGIFNPAEIKSLNTLVYTSQERVGRLNDIWLWLAGFRTLLEEMEMDHGPVVIDAPTLDAHPKTPARRSFVWSLGANVAAKSKAVSSFCKYVRSTRRKKEVRRLALKALQAFPPQEIEQPTSADRR